MPDFFQKIYYESFISITFWIFIDVYWIRFVLEIWSNPIYFTMILYATLLIFVSCLRMWWSFQHRNMQGKSGRSSLCTQRSRLRKIGKTLPGNETTRKNRYFLAMKFFFCVYRDNALSMKYFRFCLQYIYIYIYAHTRGNMTWFKTCELIVCSDRKNI